ncbi:hypothetical protein ACSV9I_06100 [Rhizobium sp. G187]|uniref:hypothetical protein n=1 Tax=Rhizobium sp. G187 TaxID=3451352 RepID=UPI003EE61567
MSQRRPVISTLLFAGALLSNASSLSATEELAWHGWSGEGVASLVYGVAESDHVVLSFSCEGKNGPINVVYSHEPKSAKPDQAYDLTLTAGKAVRIIETTGFRLEMDDLFILEGALAAGGERDLGELLSAADTLSISVEGDVTELPLAGAKEAAQKLIDTCGT